MRLDSTNSWWIHDASGRVVGVRIICPLDDGAGPHPEGHSVLVLFANPPDGGPATPAGSSPPGENDGKRWMQSGDDLWRLTLSPSLDCSCGWHGFVTNGEAK